MRDRPCYVYYVRNAQGSLLYVGVAYDLRRRFQEHRGVSAWMSRAESVHVEWYASRWEAEAVERSALTDRSDWPRHNRLRGEWQSRRDRIGPPQLIFSATVPARLITRNAGISMCRPPDNARKTDAPDVLSRY